MTKESDETKNLLHLRQKVFAYLWALAVLMNNFKQAPSLADSGVEDLLNFVTFFIAVSLFLDPKNSVKLFLLGALSVAQWIGFMPKMPNHWMIIGFVGIVLSLGSLKSFSRNLKLSTYWFINLVPLLRWSFLICYGAAAIAKWNSGFMNPEVSCAVELASKELGWFGFELGPQVTPFLPWAIAATESLIFVTLLLVRTRSLGVAIATVFHFLLSLTPVSQGLGFTFTLWALLILFLPNSSYRNLRHFSQKLENKIRIDKTFLNFIIILISTYLFINYLVQPTRSEFDNDFIWLFRVTIGLLVCVFVTTLAISGIKNIDIEQRKQPSSFLNVTIILIVAFNALSPYLGLKTHGTMTMYSNLQVEGGNSNHFFLKPIPVFPYLNDIVTVTYTDLTPLARQANMGNKITWFELQRTMHAFPEYEIHYIRERELFMFNSASESSELTSTNPIAHKLLSSRLVSTKYACLW